MRVLRLGLILLGWLVAQPAAGVARAHPRPGPGRAAGPRWSVLVKKLFSPGAENGAGPRGSQGPLTKLWHGQFAANQGAPWRRFWGRLNQTRLGLEADLLFPSLAAGVTAALLEARRPDGTIDLRRLESRYGPKALELLRSVDALDPRSDEHTAGIHRLLASYLDEDTLRLLVREVSPIEAARREMSAFRRLTAAVRRAQPLKGLRLIGIQHLVPDTGVLLLALADAGVRPENMTVAGKPHSEDALVTLDLQERGIRALPSVVRRGPQAGSRLDVKAALTKAIEEVPPGSRLLLLDDGGELISLAHELAVKRPELADRIVAVEQTRRGIRRVEGLDLRFPVIDVAQSWAKLEKESPMIGHSVGVATELKLDALRAQGFDPGKEVVLIGYGKVGRATATYFRERGYQVSAYDRAFPTSPALRAQARRDGVALYESLPSALARGRIVISATGERTIDRDNVHLLPPNALIANAASPGELDPRLLELAAAPASPFRGEYFGNAAVDFGDHRQATHRDRILHTSRGSVLLLDEGEVINFQAPKPARYIQLTTGLLYLGALQAARTRGPGIHALASQKAYVADIERQLARQGESLERPRLFSPPTP